MTADNRKTPDAQPTPKAWGRARKNGPKHDWPAMEAEYINSTDGTVTTASLAAKYKVHKRLVDGWCSKRHWVRLRSEHISQEAAKLRQHTLDQRVAYLSQLINTCTGIASMVSARYTGIHKAFIEAKNQMEKGDPRAMEAWLVRKDVQNLDVSALDKVARLKAFAEGGPDSRMDIGPVGNAISPEEAEAVLLATLKFRKKGVRGPGG